MNHRAWFIWGLGSVLYVIAMFHRTGLAVASLDAMQRFGLTASLLATFSGLQLLFYLFMQLPSGVLADSGPRRVLTIGMLLMAAGELAFAIGQSANIALAGRVLIGTGDALIFLSVLKLVQNWFAPRMFPFMSSLTAVAGGLGQIFATAPLVFLLGRFGWETTFASAAAVTVVFAALAWLVISDRPRQGLHLTTAPVEGRSKAGSAWLGLLRDLPAVVNAAGTKRGFWFHLAYFGQFVALSNLWGFPYLVQAQGLAPEKAGLLLGTCTLSFVLAAPTLGWLSREPHRRDQFMYTAALVLVLAWATVIFWPGGRLPQPLIWAVMIACGGGGAAAVLAFDIARAANPPQRGGLASGIVNTGGFSAACTIQFSVGFLLERNWTGIEEMGVRIFSPQAFQTAFLPVLFIVLLGAVFGVRLSSSKRMVVVQPGD